MNDLEKYFESIEGTGVLATADSEGLVNAAIYSRPHFLEEGSLAFIMLDRLTHHNLQSNGHATYVFIEDAPNYCGKRLYLKKIREDVNPEVIAKIRRRSTAESKDVELFLVYFSVEKELPLVGSGI